MMRAAIGIAALALIALPLVAQGRGRHPHEFNATERQAAASAAANAAAAAAEAAAAGGFEGKPDNLVDAGNGNAVYGGGNDEADNEASIYDNVPDNMSMDANMTMEPPARGTPRRGARRRR